MRIQWFPGHMSKSLRLIKENLKFIDVVIEIRDARIPHSSQNPQIESIVAQKPRLILLNKADLADATVSKKWQSFLDQSIDGKIACVFTDSMSGKGMAQVREKLLFLTRERRETDQQKGRIFRPIRTVVIGVPNVGKSMFINQFTGRKSAKTGNRPGVTTGKQWVRIDKEIELLDTPGVLWPKFEDFTTALHLAYTGAIKDEIMDTVELGAALVVVLAEKYPERLQARYQIDSAVLHAQDYYDGDDDASEMMLREDMLLTSDIIVDDDAEDESKAENIVHEIDKEVLVKGMRLLAYLGKKRGCMIAGGEVDMQRAADMVLDEFRAGKLGCISLESPEDLMDSIESPEDMIDLIESK